MEENTNDITSQFVTEDTPYEPVLETPEVSSSAETLPNVQGLVVAGWVLAILLPFVGIFINVYLLKNLNTYKINKPITIVALTVSIVLSASLLFLVFSNLFVFYTSG